MALVRGGITVKPHVQAFFDALEAEVGPISVGTYPGHSPPEGPTQAGDVFHTGPEDGYRLQNAIAEFAIKHQKRFGVRYVIKWNPAADQDTIWNIERAGEGWRAQATRDHSRHVHITFYSSGSDELELPQPPQEEPVSIIVFDARPERGGGVWQSDGIVRKPVRTGDTWPALEAAGAKHIGVAPNGLFDDLIDIEAALAARIVARGNDGGTVDYEALAEAVADVLSRRLAS